jgi:hypothetical protein
MACALVADKVGIVTVEATLNQQENLMYIHGHKADFSA